MTDEEIFEKIIVKGNYVGEIVDKEVFECMKQARAEGFKEGHDKGKGDDHLVVIRGRKSIIKLAKMLLKEAMG